MNIPNLLRLTQASAGSAASVAVASTTTHTGPGEILSGYQGYSAGHHNDRGSSSYKYDHPCIQPNYRAETSMHMELQRRNTTTSTTNNNTVNSQEHMQSLTVPSAGAQSGIGPNHLAENKPMAPPSLPSRSSPPRSTQPTDSSALALAMENGHKAFSQEQHAEMGREQRRAASSSPPASHSSSQLSCSNHHRYGDGGRLIEQNQQSSPPITHHARVHPFQQQYRQQPYNHFQPVQSRSVGSGLNTIYKMDRDRAQTGTTASDIATAVAQAHDDSINGTHSNARVRSSLSGSSNASNAPLNWSSLRNEIVSSDSSPPSTSNSTFGAIPFGAGRQSESTPLSNALPPPSSSRAFPPPPSSSTTFWPSSSSGAVSIPASVPSPHKKSFGHDVNEHAQVTGSTFTSDTGQQRRTSTLSTTIKTEEDQELLRAAGQQQQEQQDQEVTEEREDQEELQQ
ncbi:hypothetical protein BG011_008374 [Mortierella polycephala]|uniref:Uncharacterized protein n=1 Tax=Mortierella polycephala TaxID=41804 RepID=A0A9P6Q9K1_9FUNG|nr:hypothetical protein BG011_008374 [Mortierella polycephala]